MNGRKIVFIVGAPRSGTTWLQAMIGAHPGICTSDELKLFNLFTGPWEDSWQLLLRLQQAEGGGARGLRAVWSDDEFYQFLTVFLHQVYTRVLATKPGAVVVLDKTPAYANHVEHIKRLIPQAKFIHLIRDGRDVAASLRAASRGWARLWAPGKVESGARLWKSFLLGARQAKQFGEDCYLELRYEDLLQKGAPLLLEAFRFIGVAATAQQAEFIYHGHTFDKMKEGAGVKAFGLPDGFFRRGQAGDWRRTFSARERYLFHKTAGDLLCQLGYADDSWWVEKAYQRYLVPTSVLFSAPRCLCMKGVKFMRRIVDSQ
jgi:hypothetical protein